MIPRQTESQMLGASFLLKNLQCLLHPIEVGMKISHCRLDLAMAQDLHDIGKPYALSKSLRDHDC